jgi:monoamine oxidase
MGTDSVLMIEIKRFWTEGRAKACRTHVDTSIFLAIHLGVKKEGTIFSKKVYVDKKTTIARLTPEKMEQVINQTLAEIFDSFLLEPYEPTSTKGSN